MELGQLLPLHGLRQDFDSIKAAAKTMEGNDPHSISLAPCGRESESSWKIYHPHPSPLPSKGRGD